MSNSTAIGYFQRGVQKSKQEDYFGAIADFNKAIEENRKYADAYLARADARISTQQTKELLEAYADFENAVSIEPNNPKALAGRGTLRLILNPDDQEGLLDLEAAAKIDYRHSSYFNIGVARLQMEDFHGSIQAFRKYIQFEKPKDSWLGDAHFFIGQAFQNNENFEEAIRNYSLSIKFRAKENYDSAFYNRATCYGVLDRLEESLSDLKKVIQLKPNFEEAHLQISKILVYKNQRADAIKALQSAVLSNPDNVEILNELATQLFFSKEYESCIIINSKLIRLTPNQFSYYLNRAICLFKLERFSESINDFNKTVDLNSDLPHVYYYRGMAYYNLKNSQACSDWQIAMNKGVNEAKQLLYKHCK